MNLRLVRTHGPTPCVSGVLYLDGGAFGCTLERPWLDNARRLSCIPEGTYALGIQFSRRFQRSMLAVLDVLGRAGILIHGANHWSELAGCIAVAQEKVDAENIRGNLTPRLKKLVEDALKIGPVNLEIVNQWEKAE